jgi:hypothetical protein
VEEVHASEVACDDRVNGVLGALQTDLSADVREDLADLLSR